MTPLQLRLVRITLSLIFVSFGSWVGLYLYRGLTRPGGLTPQQLVDSGKGPVSRGVEISQLDSDGEVVSVLRAARSEGRTESSQLFSDVEIEFVAGDDEVPILVTAQRCELRADKSMYLEGNVIVRDSETSRLEAATLNFAEGPERVWSDDPVRFFRESSRGSAGKMRYLLKRGNIELEQSVRMLLVERGDDPVRIRSETALMRRRQQRIRFIDDVFVRQRDRSLRSNDLVLVLRNGNEQIEMAEAFENAELLMDLPPPEESMLAEFDETLLDGPAEDSAKLEQHDAEQAAGESTETPNLKDFSIREPGKKRLTSNHIEFLFQPDSDKLQRVRAVDGGQLEFEPPEGETDGFHRVLDAHLIAFDFDEQGELKLLRARGGVTLTMTPLDGNSELRVLTARQLETEFDTVTGDMTLVTCTNAVDFKQGVLHATGEVGSYDASRDELRLEQGPTLSNDSASLEADSILIHAETGRVQGTGNVQSKSAEESDNSMFPGARQSKEPVFFLADRIDYDSSTEHAIYVGSARGIQGENRIEARQIEIFSSRGELHAQGNVRTVFYQNLRAVQEQSDETSESDDAPAPPTEPQPTVTLARRFTYLSEKQMMQYRRQVDMRAPELSVTGDRVEFALGEAEGTIEQIEVNGNVVIKTAEADAEGDYAKYLPQSEEMRVTGNDATLRNGDKVTLGKQLTFFLSNDRVLVDGLEANRTKSTFTSRPRSF